MKKEELKPCPFCGSKAYWWMDEEQNLVTCSNDKCAVNETTFTIEDWNRRTP